MKLKEINHPIIDLYESLGKNFDSIIGTDVATDLFFEVYKETSGFLSKTSNVKVRSLIPEKRYISFTLDGRIISRPINEEIFKSDLKIINKTFKYIKENKIQELDSSFITQSIYSITMSFCVSIDLIKKNDQKTPGTYFERLVGHLFSVFLGIKPIKEIEVLSLDSKMKLPTDFIFDLGKNKPKLHVPVKTSTRERVIQVWAHQRILDGVFGVGTFLGFLNCIGETKLDHSKREVIEICLPDQWNIYQRFIARLSKVYYLDLPRRYKELEFVKPFGDFFHENTELFI